MAGAGSSGRRAQSTGQNPCPSFSILISLVFLNSIKSLEYSAINFGNQIDIIAKKNRTKLDKTGHVRWGAGGRGLGAWGMEQRAGSGERGACLRQGFGKQSMGHGAWSMEQGAGSIEQTELRTKGARLRAQGTEKE